MEIKESVRLIKVSVDANSNKFWNADLYDDGHYEANWGRVGANGQSGSYQGENKFHSKIRSKKKDGYVEQKTIAENTTAEVSQGDLHTVTKQQIQTTNPTLDNLISRLVKANIHQITANTQIQFNNDSGIFQTPLGIVTLDGIKEASDILSEVYNVYQSKGDSFYQLVNDYLRIVPQKVGRNVRTFIDDNFTSVENIRKQKDLLESLEVSFNTVNTQPDTSDTKTHEKVFDIDLELLEDKRVYSRLEDNYYRTRKRMHRYDNVDIKRIYKVTLNQMNNVFDSDGWGNIKEYYHGTNIANCLSIMKSGLKIAPPSTAQIAGKMFGNGVYGANCSSKSLGYSMGRWGQGSSNDGAWLFVCDFAMGNSFYAKRTCNRPPSGYDSVSALEKNTSLYNDEFIVYNNNQVNIKYLIECEIK
jgi:poly [ADP-ribose] polymerase